MWQVADCQPNGAEGQGTAQAVSFAHPPRYGSTATRPPPDSGMGIRRDFRLTRPDDYARLRREGRVYRHRWFMISVLANDTGHNRYGVITGKKIGKAVVRNRVRRLLQEAIRLYHPCVQQGYDVVFIVHPVCVGQGLAAICDVLQVLYRQAGLVD